jgi:hypothetical protein
VFLEQKQLFVYCKKCVNIKKEDKLRWRCLVMKEADKKKTGREDYKAHEEHGRPNSGNYKEDLNKKPSQGSCGDKKGPCSDSHK